MKLSTVRDIARTYGPAAAVHDLTKRALNRVTPLQVLTTLRVTMAGVNPTFLEAQPGLRADFVSEEELFAFAKDPRYDLDDDFVRAALAKGDRCFALCDGSQLAAYGWYSRKPTLITPRLELHFAPRYVYMYKGFTEKAYRGRRLHAFGMAGALSRYAAEGAAGLVSYVDSTNFASLQSCDRMGYERIGHILVVTVAGYTFTRTIGSDSDADTDMHVEVLS